MKQELQGTRRTGSNWSYVSGA